MSARAALAVAALALAAAALTAEARPSGGEVAKPVPGRPATTVAALPPPRPDTLREAAEPSATATPAPSADQPVPPPEPALESGLRGSLPEPISGAAPPLPPLRPAFRGDGPTTPPSPAAAEAPIEPPVVPPPAAPAPTLLSALFGPPSSGATPTGPVGGDVSPSRARLNQLIAHHARLHGVPEALVHRVVVRESRYNPRAVGRGGAMGLMQIKTATARGMGYAGGPAGLLDAETNLAYAVPYLAGAYRTAGGNHDRAVGYYARGYYYAAKRMGVAGPSSGRGRPAREEPLPTFATAPAAAAPPVVAVADDRYAR